MSLRIAFDLDGVLADMESELLRQATTLFGEQAIRQAQQLASPPVSKSLEDTAKEAPDAPEARPKSDQPKPEGEADEVPATRLHLTSRQMRRLWRHVESFPNFWETLDEMEPGMIAKFAETHDEHAQRIAGLVEASTQEAAPERRESLLDELKQSVEEFEGSHPRLVSFVTEYSAFLSALGI